MNVGDNVVLRGTIKGVTYGAYGFPHYLVTLPNGCETEFPKPYIENLQQLDEPEKVKVPQFVADWYEKKKHDLNHYIWDYIYNWNHQEESEFKRWMNCSIISFQTLVNMHQFGYEVEKEKRYYVRFKWIEDSYSYLTLIKHLHAWTLKDITLDKKFRIAHTRKELEEAGFGWVLDCPGIEIEEVEE